MPIVFRTATGKDYNLIGIRAACLQIDRFLRIRSVMTTAIRFLMRAGSLLMAAQGLVVRTCWFFMMSPAAMMLRMDVRTGHAFSESRHKGTAGTLAGVHVKTYDTHAVPYD